MSKKKTINLLEGIAQIILLALLFILPYVHVTIDMDFQWARNVDIAVGTYTFFELTVAAPNFLHIVTIGLMIINAVICFVSANSKSITRDGALHNAVTIIIFLLGAVLSFMRGEVGYNMAVFTVFQTAFMLLSTTIMILSFVKRSKVIVPKGDAQNIINNVQETSNADELKKYKDLLDNGVITQEEFDEKKKQLLGL